jgi:hypothetical protein
LGAVLLLLLLQLLVEWATQCVDASSSCGSRATGCVGLRRQLLHLLLLLLLLTLVLWLLVWLCGLLLLLHCKEALTQGRHGRSLLHFCHHASLLLLQGLLLLLDKQQLLFLLLLLVSPLQLLLLSCIQLLQLGHLHSSLIPITGWLQTAARLAPAVVVLSM